jgi:hypothetical protein
MNKILRQHVNGDKFLKYKDNFYYPFLLFPNNFESEEIINNKIESLMDAHFNDVDVIVHFNNLSSVQKGKKMNKKNVLITHVLPDHLRDLNDGKQKLLNNLSF